MKDFEMEKIIPMAGQVWLYRQPAVEGQSAYEFNVKVLSSDPQSKRCVIASHGLAWTECVSFDTLRARANLVGTTTVG
jgi:hypothetical protein